MRSIAVIMALFFFASCNTKEKDIESHLAKINIDSSFKLDTVNTVKWDLVYIVVPYQKVKLEDYKISNSIKKEIVDISRTNDIYCSLLFFQDKELVNYSIVPIITVDFSQLNKDTFSSNQEYYLNEKRIVTIK